MGETSQPEDVLILLAAFSRYDAALDWARDKATSAWGPIALASDVFSFAETDYYEPTMGSGLAKCFWTFDRLADPGTLAELKLQTNAWELEYAGLGRHPEERPLNLDPGYLTLAKLVLASTKDHAHRLYLARGIYAEVTLTYKDRHWRSHPWTFPDYQRGDYQVYLTQCRDLLRTRVRQERLR